MNDKQKQIEYWKKTALDDFEAVYLLLSGNKNLQALFFIHLTLEKLIKANWVKDNTENFPPKTHNLIYLYNNCKSLNLTESETDFLQMMNSFQLEGRYPDYVNQLYNSVNKQKVEQIITESKPIIECLINNLQ